MMRLRYATVVPNRDGLSLSPLKPGKTRDFRTLPAIRASSRKATIALQNWRQILKPRSSRGREPRDAPATMASRLQLESSSQATLTFVLLLPICSASLLPLDLD